MTNNLVKIWYHLFTSMGESERFPASLAEPIKSQPTNSDLDANLLVCPGTGNSPGPMNSVDDWSDYIYVGRAWEGIPDTALLISPPENHGGDHGYVLCVGGNVARLKAADARALVAKPWLLDTHITLDKIRYLTNEMSIHVPKRLRPYYPAVGTK